MRPVVRRVMLIVAVLAALLVALGMPATPATAGPPAAFTAQQTFATGLGPNSVAVGDFNGDGKPDLAVANLSSNTVSVLLGNGDGTFAPQQTFATGSSPYSVAVGDLNGDGLPDLAVSDANSNMVSVLLDR